MVLFFLVPFGFVLKDQSVADRDRAAALSARVRFHRRVGGDQGGVRAALAGYFRLLVSDNLYISSYLRSLVVAVTSTLIPAVDSATHRLWHGAPAATLAGDLR